MIKPSTDYALVNEENVVVEKGSAKKMRKRKKQLKGHRIYLSPSSQINDTVR